MKIKTITLGKEFKVGLPNFSNLTLHCEMTFELGENEEPDMDKMWDYVNHELHVQSSGIDPTWLETKSYQNFFKVTAKIQKGGE